MYAIVIQSPSFSLSLSHSLSLSCTMITSFHSLWSYPSEVLKLCEYVFVCATLYWSENSAFNVLFRILGASYLVYFYTLVGERILTASIRWLQFLSLSFNHMHRILSKFKPICHVSLIFFSLAVCLVVCDPHCNCPMQQFHVTHAHISNVWHRCFLTG